MTKYKMTTVAQPTLQSPRLLLQSLTENDWQAVSYLRTDAAVNTYVDRPTAPTKAEALAFINRITEAVATTTSYYWKIALQGNTTMIGSICLWNFAEDGTTAEIGYDLGTAYHNKGFMTEALKVVVQFCFSHLGIQTLEAYTHVDNKASIQLLLKNGFVLQPEQRDPDVPDNRIYVLQNNS